MRGHRGALDAPFHRAYLPPEVGGMGFFAALQNDVGRDSGIYLTTPADVILSDSEESPTTIFALREQKSSPTTD